MKTIAKIWNIVSWILVFMLVLCALLLVGVRLIGLTPYAILSGSMEPTYHVGSIIYVKSVPSEAIEVGDPITFVLNEDLVVATHRVIDIDAENELFYTQGDANSAPDGKPVHWNNLLGRPVFSIPKLGYFSEWITSPPGIYIGICAAAALIILMFLPDMLKRADSADREKAASKKR